MIPLINGVNYASANVNVILPILGAVVAGIQGITYRKETNVVDNYSLGQDPTSRAFGQNTYTGSLEIYKEVWNQIIDASPLRDPSLLPIYDIVVTYGGNFGGNTVPFRKETLRGCTFKTNGSGVAGGDTKIVVTVDLAIGGIDF